MSTLSPEQIVTLTEIAVMVGGIAIIWAVYHDSEAAELPGEAAVPAPGEADDALPDTEGRTLA